MTAVPPPAGSPPGTPPTFVAPASAEAYTQPGRNASVSLSYRF
jgi:hemoglobin/transferrin/lactoferrin receptor protein